MPVQHGWFRKGGGRTLPALLIVLAAAPISAAQLSAATERCDGYPRLAVKTPDKFCVGVVAERLRFPRGILPLPDGNLLVAEMGSWNEKRGSLLLLEKTATGFMPRRLIDGLDRPHGLARGPDGRVYIGEVGRISRFDPATPAAPRVDVIGGKSGVAPLPADGRHPLANMVFDNAGDLYVNVGSASDNCEGPGNSLPPADQPCAETTGEGARGVIRKYRMRWPQGTVTQSTVHARGLRNSMALAVHPRSNLLLQAENARDAIHLRLPGLRDDEELPHDEINIIEAGAHYGWPYCFDAGRASPEFPRADCRQYRSPQLLLPPHAAPLGMTFVDERAWPPPYRGALLLVFHGYRRHGHRVVAFEADERGVPRGAARDLISGWGAAGGRRAGTPVDAKFGADGALYITEDRNGTVLRLSYQP
jgi:glucose/arabinose dehydrogenase